MDPHVADRHLYGYARDSTPLGSMGAWMALATDRLIVQKSRRLA
jgi:hypothetical protein